MAPRDFDDAAPVRVVLGEGGFLAREGISAVLERAAEIELVAVSGDLAGLRGAIAGELVLTKRGVERHVNNIFSKLDLGDGRAVSRRVKAALVYLGSDGLD